VDIITAHAFIDWDSARRVRRPSWGNKIDDVPLKDRVRHVEECFSELQFRTASALEKIDLNMPVRVVMSRIYHGWHRGITPTEDRRSWELARQNLKLLTTRKVSYLPDTRFGDALFCGGKRTPLVDTLRRRDDGVDQQKMVDTALVADLLSFGRTESAGFRRGESPRSMAIVIGNDDDLLPGSFAVEQWGLPVKVLRINRDRESRFLRVNEMVYSL
jgi:hypothetical protein